MQTLKSLILALTIAGLSGTALAQHSEYRVSEYPQARCPIT